MSCTFAALTVLLGASLVMGFVLHPSEEEPKESTSSADSGHSRCQRETQNSIRKGLLRALNLQSEPQLPVVELTALREQWKSTFSAAAHASKGSAVPALSGNSGTPGVGNSTVQKCCPMASKILLKDLGWDSWVIYPESITFVQCGTCNTDARCPPHPPTGQENPSESLCCQPTSQEMVGVVYMDQLSTVVISSVRLTRTCGCSAGNRNPDEEESIV